MKLDIDFLDIPSSSYLSALFENVDRLQNILFIDTASVIEYEILVESANETTLAIPYNPTTTTRQNIDDILLHIYSRTKCSRIGFVFATYGYCVNTLIENRSYDDDDNVDWLVDVIRKYEIQIMDFFGCKTMVYDSWKQYYGKLVAKTDVTIYANPNMTGNSEYGGEWQLNKFCDSFAVFRSENNIDVKIVYFNSNVQKYKNLLDGRTSTLYLIDNEGFVWSTGNNTYNKLGRAVNSNDNRFLGSIPLNAIPNVTNYTNTISTVGNGPNISFISLNPDPKNINNGKRLYYIGNNPASNYPGFTTTETTGTDISFISCALYNNFVAIDGVDLSNVTKIINANNTSSYVLTERGNLYQTGTTVGPSAESITNASNIKKFRLSASNIPPISDVQVGLNGGSVSVLLLLKNSKKLYGYGSPTLLGTTGTTATSGAFITPATNDPSFTQISMSNTHTMALSTTNKIYCTGYNTNGQFGNPTATLGLNTNESWVTMILPRLPSSGAPTISAIVAGNNVSYVLYNDGSLYGCGDNTKNQINSTNTPSYNTLKLINPPFRTTIKQVACMTNSTHILTTDNIPYSVGSGPNGIGIGLATSATVFTQMSTDSDRSALMFDVSCIGDTKPITVTQKIPSKPSLVQIPGKVNTLTVTFNASTSLGFSDTSLNYYYYLDEKVESIVKAGRFTTSNSTFDISGLTPGYHTVALVAKIVDSTNNELWSSGVSPASDSVRPYIAGSAPTIPTVTRGLNSLKFSIGESTGGDPSANTYYYFDLSLNGKRISDLSGKYVDVSSVVFSNLSAGLHTVVVKAKELSNNNVDILWTSPDATNTGTPYVLGSAPTIISVTPLSNKLTVKFSASIGGNPLPTYLYSLDGGVYTTAITNGGSTFEITIPSENTANTHSVKMIAQNAAGDTALSTEVIVIMKLFITKVVEKTKNEFDVYFIVNKLLDGSKMYYSIDSGINFIEIEYLLEINEKNTYIATIPITDETSDYNILIKHYPYNDIASYFTISNIVTVVKPSIAPKITRIENTNNGFDVYFIQGQISGNNPLTFLYSLDGGIKFTESNIKTQASQLYLSITNGIINNKVYRVVIRASNTALALSNEVIVKRGSSSLYWASQYWSTVSYWRNASYWSKRR